MIYAYESEILKYINNIFEDITETVYAPNETIFNMMQSVTHFPVSYCTRAETEWVNNKVLHVTEDDYKCSAMFVPYEQEYTGRILVENQGKAIEMANKLRFAIHKNPKVSIMWPELGDQLPVAIRLLYIKVSELRNPTDTKGACRFVEFKWKSTLFQSDVACISNPALVEKVRIYLSTVERQVIDDSYLVETNLIKEL